jgi:hypothetical protein
MRKEAQGSLKGGSRIVAILLLRALRHAQHGATLPKLQASVLVK